MITLRFPERIETFPDLRPDKAQALKVTEEAAEVYSAWEDWRADPRDIARYNHLIDECADVIQAATNLAASIGWEDMSVAMDLCHERNQERGRYGREA